MTDLAVVGAGLAVVIGVVALLTSAEVAKRLQALVDHKLTEAEVKLEGALAKQDEQITTLRKFMSSVAEDNEASLRSLGKDLKEIKSCIALLGDAVTRLEDDGSGNGTRGRGTSKRASRR